jgi:hypothetical protein
MVAFYCREEASSCSEENTFYIDTKQGKRRRWRPFIYSKNLNGNEFKSPSSEENTF